MDRLNNFNSPFTSAHFNKAFSGFLLQEGTTLYNVMYLYWQLMDNVSAYWNDDFIAKIDIKTLTNDYINWILEDATREGNYLDPNYDHRQDKEYKYYNLILMLASYAGVKREHEVGALSLAHILRLISFHFGQRMFDGSREKLAIIYENLELTGMEFALQTKTGDEIHGGSSNTPASCAYTIYVPEAMNDTVLFNNTDKLLWFGGYYNLEILGIVYDYNILSSDALIYDNPNLKYDDYKKYDGGTIS